ncbi:uncharacterized protein LOC126477561 [Schistocerca serialis cubense]|uniref:uncharacterized protein LOC126477561 n=1 Tax=Schistocerca serialis cubense TaxID=2023355 RepID=UPI00214E9643|nr:uncharacterized protein LOC126477561 [Schistocerca serialis cubense]XP_049959584.1 uncharacterized protein LOC126477561 [Schistocerca serialis cubense]
MDRLCPSIPENRLAIETVVNKFQRTGSVADEEHPSRLAIMPDTVQSVQDAITRSLSAPTRRLSRELGIPQTTVWRVLRYKLHKRAYHIQIVHNPEAEDYAARQAVCHELLQAVENDNLMQNVLFNDEAIFHTCGHVNRHNCRIWADKQPSVLQDWQRDTAKVNVWLGMTRSTVYGPSFSTEQTVTGTTQLDMLEQFLGPS